MRKYGFEFKAVLLRFSFSGEVKTLRAVAVVEAGFHHA